MISLKQSGDSAEFTFNWPDQSGVATNDIVFNHFKGMLFNYAAVRLSFSGSDDYIEFPGRLRTAGDAAEFGFRLIDQDGQSVTCRFAGAPTGGAINNCVLILKRL